MTPAERIAAATRAVDSRPLFRGERSVDDVMADAALDALCPRGERIVLDRTGDTDRLIHQRQGRAWEINNSAQTLWATWVDVNDPDQQS